MALPKKELAKTSLHKKLFLKIFAETGAFYSSCEETGVVHQTVYLWQEKDPEFAKDYEEAKKKYIEKMEKVADKRAIGEGVDKASDLMMIFRLKGLAPEKYRERQDITAKGEITVRLEEDALPKSPEP